MSKSAVMQTWSGRRIDLVMCAPEDFHLIDIAHALSHVNRFGGHTPVPYSVGQHSLVCAAVAIQRGVDELSMLLHDAAEAYIGDMPRHIKEFLGDRYINLEDHIGAMIAIRFDTVWPMTPEMKQIDHDVLETEFRDIVRRSFDGREIYGKALEWPIFAMNEPNDVAKVFLRRADTLIRRKSNG